jgi:hypothetical protein
MSNEQVDGNSVNYSDKTDNVEDHDNDNDNDNDDILNDTKMMTRSRKHGNSNLIGRKIVKEFPPFGFFDGEIDSFKNNYYHITYCDGDEEEVTEAEATAMVQQKNEEYQYQVNSINVPQSNISISASGDDEVDCAETDDVVEELCQLATSALTDAGLVTFCSSIEGGNKNTKECKGMMLHLGRFLAWTFFNITSQSIDDDHLIQKLQEGIDKKKLDIDIVLVWLAHLLEKRFRVIGEFTKHLYKEKELSSGTIKNYLSSIKNGGLWLCMSERASSLNFTRTRMNQAELIIKCYTRHHRHNYAKQQIAKKSDVTKLVQDGKLPQNGMSDIQKLIQAKMTSMTEMISDNSIDRTKYALFVGFVIATLYAYAPQGRIGGICAMTTDNAIELLSTTMTDVYEFKTAHTYGVQPILTERNGQHVLRMYLKYLRPNAVERSLKLNVYKEDPASLWIRYNGKPYCSSTLGR